MSVSCSCLIRLVITVLNLMWDCCGLYTSHLCTQTPYQSSISAVLAASTCVRDLQHSQGWRKLDSSHIPFAATVSKVATAVEEVTQLLGTQKQQQGASQAAQHVQLQALAGNLLRWCAAGGGGILTMPDRIQGVSMQLRAVELAAALAQSLHTGGDRAAVERHVSAVLQVLDRCGSVNWPGCALARTHSSMEQQRCEAPACSSAGLIQVLHCTLCQQ